MRSLIPWRRSNVLEEMRREMDDVMRRFFATETEATEGNGVTSWAPLADLVENEKEFVVKVDLPGVDPKDMDIAIRDGVLTIKGAKREEREEKKENYHRKGRFDGSFERDIALPSGVDENKISATASINVITITVPKTPAAQPKKIPLKAAT